MRTPSVGQCSASGLGPKRLGMAKFKRRFARAIPNNLRAPHTKMWGLEATKEQKFTQTSPGTLPWDFFATLANLEILSSVIDLCQIASYLKPSHLSLSLWLWASELCLHQTKARLKRAATKGPNYVRTLDTSSETPRLFSSAGMFPWKLLYNK